MSILSWSAVSLRVHFSHSPLISFISELVLIVINVLSCQTFRLTPSHKSPPLMWYLQSLCAITQSIRTKFGERILKATAHFPFQFPHILSAPKLCSLMYYRQKGPVLPFGLVLLFLLFFLLLGKVLRTANKNAGILVSVLSPTVFHSIWKAYGLSANWFKQVLMV